MRKFILAVAMVGLAHSAHAADMPDVPLRGGFADGLGGSRTYWQGYYVGGQASYSSINAKPSPTLNDDLQSTYVSPIGGAYAWAPLGAAPGQGQGWGAFAGYNSQWDDVVVGVEANYIHDNLKGSSTATAVQILNAGTLTTTSNATINVTDFGSARLRAGYVIGNFLPYMFGGAGVGYQIVDRSISAIPAPLPLPTVVSSDRSNKLVYGYSAGAGVDVMLIAGLFLRAEYEYQRITSTIESNIHSARVGVGYKF